MNILQSISNALRYLTEGATRLFSPVYDEYPAIGVQPFDGEPYSKWVASNKR